jgi:hypothetical protein
MFGQLYDMSKINEETLPKTPNTSTKIVPFAIETTSSTDKTSKQEKEQQTTTTTTTPSFSSRLESLFGLKESIMKYRERNSKWEGSTVRCCVCFIGLFF